MPRGYRCVLVAFVGWLSLAAAPPQESAEHKAPNAQSETAKAIADTTAAKKAVEDAKYQEPCKHGEDRRYSDLCAQWKAADAAYDAAQWAWYQLGISFFGVIGLGLTIWLTARSTRASIDALEAQIASERPLMHMSKINVVPQKPTKEYPLRIKLDWMATNHGKTGCWVEQVNITLQPGTAACNAHLNGVFNLSSFVAPGKNFGSSSNQKIYTFDPGRLAIVKQTKRISASGYILYRDAGGREWMTGYANVIELADDFTDTRMFPIPKKSAWFDKRQK